MQAHAAWGIQGGESDKQGVSFPLGLTLELHEQLLESVVIWAVPYKESLTGKELLGFRWQFQSEWAASYLEAVTLDGRR